MLNRSLFALLLICTSALVTFAQQVSASSPKPTDEKDALIKQAVAFLRETSADVNTMRTAENRISFSAELASLMWLHDEKEARSMYLLVFAEFRNLLIRYNTEMNEFPAIDDEEDDPDAYRGMSFLTEPTDRRRLMKKFETAMAVRQQIALSLAEHDPDLAISFYSDGMSFVSSAEFRSQIETRDTYFQTQLINQIAENNAGKAAQLAAKSLDKGVDHQHVELLKKLHAKDPDKAAEFASSILSALKSEIDKKGNLGVISSLIDFGDMTLKASKKPDGKKTVYSESELRDLAEILASRILKSAEKDDDDDHDYDYSSPLAYVANLEKYAPNRAIQIKAKFKGSKADAYSAAANAMNAASNAVMTAANSNVSGNSAKEARSKAEQQMLDDIEKLESKKLPKEEREKFIATARKIINQMSGRDKKVVALSGLATQVAKLGDKELAASIMKDAEALVNPAPKNYQEYLLSLMLASGYATVEPDKAFVLLEDTIMRASDTLNAFVKVGEFIDVAGEMVVDGEVQVGAFGGQMVRGLSKELGAAENIIQLLVKADFAKTKNLTTKFERTEARVLAKMMVLRTVLQKKDPVPQDAGTAEKKAVTVSVK